MVAIPLEAAEIAVQPVIVETDNSCRGDSFVIWHTLSALSPRNFSGDQRLFSNGFVETIIYSGK